MFILSSEVWPDDQLGVTVIDAEADALTWFEAGGGKPVVGDLHPWEMLLPVRGDPRQSKKFIYKSTLRTALLVHSIAPKT